MAKKPQQPLVPTLITCVVKTNGKLLVRGHTSDNGPVKRVIVNGQEAKAMAANFSEWQVELAASEAVAAHAEDAAGNVEKLPHKVAVGK